MASIFSVQNLHTFLRRKNLRPPSRGPPGPLDRKGRRSPPPPPLLAGASLDGVGLVSSAMMLLKKSAVGCWLLVLGLCCSLPSPTRPLVTALQPRAESCVLTP